MKKYIKGLIIMNQIDFIAELAKIRPASTFLSVMGYRNAYSEIANYSLLFHMNYENALKKSINELQNMSLPEHLVPVKDELIKSFNKSISKIKVEEIKDIDDGYTRFFDDNGNYIKGVKYHNKTGTIHLYGLVVHKLVTMPGIYPESSLSEKDKLRKKTTVGKFRQFKMLPEQVNHISVENISLLPPESF